MKSLLCAWALLAALSARADIIQWGNVTVNTADIPTTDIPFTNLVVISPIVVSNTTPGITMIALPVMAYNGVLVPALPLPTGFVPLTVLQRYPVQVQALAVKTLISNWMTVYAALDTTGLYQWNHFAIEAASIEIRAKTQGINDEILSECAAFSAALKKAKQP